MTISKFLCSLVFLLCAISAQATDLVSERAWVEDPASQMTLEQVKQAEETPLPLKFFSQGYSKSVFWIRLRIDPNQLQDKSVQRLVIRMRPPYQDQIWIYDPLAAQDKMRVTGDYYDWADDEYRSLNLNFVIPVGTEPRDIWLKLKATVSTLTFIEVMTEDQVRAADRRQEIISMLYLSALFVCFGWAALTRINRKDKLLSYYLLREIVVIVYSLAVLGYLRVFSSGWLPPGWLDALTNLIGFFFAAVVIWFDWRLISEFKPNRWISRAHWGLILFFPIQVAFVLMGKTYDAARISSLVIFIAIFLALISTISTTAWKEARNKPEEEQPMCSKSFLVALYSLVIVVALLHRLPLVGISSGSELFVYFNLVYPLLTSFTLIILIQLRLYRQSKYQQQKQLRLEMAEIEVRTERSQRIEQASFLNMLAHEMKTPLSVVRMALGGDSLSSKTREVVDRAVTDMDSIIERLMQVERLEDDRIELNQQNFDLREMVKGLCLSLPQSDRIREVSKGEMIFNSDQQLVRVIISNLLENALKYSPQNGNVNIVVNSDLDEVTILVENEVGSAGYPSHERVFEKYYRSPLAHQRTGSGLGLYLVKSLVALLGGKITYVSDTKYVRFEVRLPRKQ